MQSSERSLGAKIRTGALWVLTVLAAALMILAGSAKFTAAEWWASAFVTWGYPEWFSYLTGGAEMIFAIAMLVPRFASYAAGVLIVIMLGALVTVLIHPGDMGPIPPIANTVALSVIFAARWKVRWQPS